jgi:hypothetical protein
MELDLTSLRKELMESTCEGFYILCNAYAIQQTKVDNITGDDIHPQVINIIRRQENMIHYIFPDGFASFSEYYKRKYNVTTDMVDANTNVAAGTTVATEPDTATDISILTDNDEASIAFNPRFFPNVRTRTVVTINTRTTAPVTINNILLLNDNSIRSVHFLLNTIYNRTWAAYKLEHDTRILNTMLNKYTTSVLTTKATDETAAVIDNEPTIDPNLLKDIIANEVNKATKSLKQQITKMGQTMQRNAKNSDRGDNTATGRASSKKLKKQEKNSTKKQTSKTKKQKNSKSTKQGRNKTTAEKKIKQDEKKQVKRNTSNKKSEKAGGNNRGSQKGRKKEQSTAKNPKRNGKRTSTAN